VAQKEERKTGADTAKKERPASGLEEMEPVKGDFPLRGAQTDQEYVFHIGEGPDDFSAVASMWPKRYGVFAGNQCAESDIANAIRGGSLIMIRDKSDDHVIGATVLDYSTSADSIVVRFNVIKEDEEDPASILRAQIEMVIKLLIHRGLNRLVVHREQDIADDTALARFNEFAQSYGLPIRIEVLGTVRDLFGDGRTVSLTSVFIQPSDRPDLISNVVSVAKTAASSAFQSVGGLVFAAGICSGCKEGKEGGEKKDGKDGDKAAAMMVPLTKLTLEVEATSLFAVYSQVGIQRFNRYNQPSRYTPLV
jgi:hypothetical protein